MQSDRYQPLRWEPVRIERPWMDDRPRETAAELRAETRPIPDLRWGRRRERSRFHALAAEIAENLFAIAREVRRRAEKVHAYAVRRRGSLAYALDHPSSGSRFGRSRHRFKLAGALYALPVLAGGLGIVALTQQFQENQPDPPPKVAKAAVPEPAVVERAQDSKPATPAMPDFSVVDKLPQRELVRVAPESEAGPADSQRLVVARTVTPEEAGAPLVTTADVGFDAPRSPEQAPDAGEPAAESATDVPEPEEAEAETAAFPPEPKRRPEIPEPQAEQQAAAETPPPEAPSATPAAAGRANTPAPQQQAVSTTAAVVAPQAAGEQTRYSEAVRKAAAYLQAGEVYSARKLLRPGAWANDAATIQLLAQTYDPEVLARLDKSERADANTARTLYKRAKELGGAGRTAAR